VIKSSPRPKYKHGGRVDEAVVLVAAPGRALSDLRVLHDLNINTEDA